MLPNTAATMRQSSTVPTTAGTSTTLDVVGTLLEGAANKLVVIRTVLIVYVVKCGGVSERCVPISSTLLTGGITVDDCDNGVSVTSELEISAVSLYTSDDCDDDVSATSELVTSAVLPYISDDCDDDASAEYVDTVEQSMGIGPRATQLHFESEFMQLLMQTSLLSKVMLVSDVKVSKLLSLTVTLPMHHQVTLVVTREQENWFIHWLLKSVLPVHSISPQHCFHVHDMEQDEGH